MGPDARGDGDGWLQCGLGHRHWGLFGAAGLLLHRPGTAGGSDGPVDDGEPGSSGSELEVLLQHRATWSHHGGTWGLLGGARHSDESAVSAALREAGEEGGLVGDGIHVHGRFDDAHGGWAYTTVLASTGRGTSARPTGGESIDVAWVAVSAVSRLDLHPGFGSSWPALRGALLPLTVVVDAANVVGSRPDGWWRDRAGAARRLVAACASLPRDGVPGADLPPGLDPAGLSLWWPRVVLVVEGEARAARDEAAPPAVEVVAAPGSGDDEVVAVVERSGPGPVVVVTADRELRQRVSAARGATVGVVGPRWLTERLPDGG